MLRIISPVRAHDLTRNTEKTAVCPCKRRRRTFFWIVETSRDRRAKIWFESEWKQLRVASGFDSNPCRSTTWQCLNVKLRIWHQMGSSISKRKKVSYVCKLQLIYKLTAVIYVVVKVCFCFVYFPFVLDYEYEKIITKTVQQHMYFAWVATPSSFVKNNNYYSEKDVISQACASP